MDNNLKRWAILGRAMLFFIGCAVILATVAPLAPRGSGRATVLFIGVLAGLGAFGLTRLFVRWDGLHLTDIGASPDRWSPLRLGFGLLIGSFLIGLQSAIVWRAGHVHWVRVSEARLSGLLMALVAYLTLASREELAFHGYPLRRLMSCFGLWGGQFIIALVFALEHVAGGMTWGHALLGSAIGSLLFGMAAIATRGLALPIGLHAAWNVGDWMRGGKDSIGFWKPVVDAGFEDRAAFVQSTSYVLVMVSTILAFWWWRQRCARSIR